jgi:hypothetical protein
MPVDSSSSDRHSIPYGKAYQHGQDMQFASVPDGGNDHREKSNRTDCEVACLRNRKRTERPPLPTARIEGWRYVRLPESGQKCGDRSLTAIDRD